MWHKTNYNQFYTMKKTILFLVLFVSFFSFGQKTIDADKLHGTPIITGKSVFVTKNQELLINYPKKKVLYNSKGELIKSFEYKSNIKIPSFPLWNYDMPSDIGYVNMPKGFFIRKDFSKENSKDFKFKIPEINNIQSSRTEPKSKGNTVYLKGNRYYNALESNRFGYYQGVAYFASSYVSTSQNSHGDTKPSMDKYNSFVQVVTMDLESGAVKENIILKDVFSIMRNESSTVSIKVVGQNQNLIRIAVVEGEIKKDADIVYGGVISYYSYNLLTNEVKIEKEEIFECPLGTQQLSCFLSSDGFAVKYSTLEEGVESYKVDFYTLENDFSINKIQFKNGINEFCWVHDYRYYKDSKQTNYLYSISQISGENRARFERWSENRIYPLIDLDFGGARMAYIDPITGDEFLLEFETEDDEELKKYSEPIFPLKKINFSYQKYDNFLLKNEDGSYTLVKIYWDTSYPPKDFTIKFIPVTL